MAYEKYTISDAFEANLDTGIGASDTSIILGTGEGDGLPSGTQKTILRLVQYTTSDDPTTAIVKSEYVLCTNRSGDIITVTRGFDGSTATTFDGGDYIYCVNHTAVIEDIQDEVTRLENDKADDDEVVKLTGNQTIAGNKTFIGTTETDDINSSGTITATDFVGGGSGLTNVTSDINNNTTDTNIADGDFIPFYDVSEGINKKITADNLNRALQNSQYLGVVASDTLRASADTEKSYVGNGISDTKFKEIKIGEYSKGGTIRVKYEAKSANTNNLFTSIRVNGTQVVYDSDNNTSYAEYSHDISISAGDLVSLYGDDDDSGSVRNFRIYYDEVKYTRNLIVNLD